jgi:competence protein ComGC
VEIPRLLQQNESIQRESEDGTVGFYKSMEAYKLTSEKNTPRFKV